MNAQGYIVRAVSGVLVVCAASIALFVRTYTVQGISMEPTLTAGMRIVVVEVAWPPLLHRGTVVVFRDPRTSEHQLEVKRIVGLPTETVSIQNDIVSLAVQGGTGSSERTVLEKDSPLGRRDNGKDMSMILGPEDYFLMGDNRPGSRDSRHVGTIQPSEMLGVVVASF